MSTSPPPPTPEERALKQQVADALARDGVLSKIKAELRAAVFRVLHERGGPEPASERAANEQPAPPTLGAFPAAAAAAAVELIAECLAFFQWDHSLLVLRAEAALEAQPLAVDGRELARRLGLKGAAAGAPVLLQLVQERLGSRPPVEADSSAPPAADAPVLRPPSPWRPGRMERGEESPEERRGGGRSEGGGAEEARAAGGGSRGGEAEGMEEEREQGEAQEEEVEEVEELDESMAEDIASASEEEEEEEEEEEAEEESRELASPAPRDLSAHVADSGAPVLPPPVPTRLALASPAVEDGAAADDARDDEFDSEDEAARLSSLDAKLQAMEAEDDTGTLQQLKASLQLELERGDERDDPHNERDDERDEQEQEQDDDGDGYGSSDFEEEEEIASEVSEDVEAASDAEAEADGSEASTATAVPAALMADRAVESPDALDSYDYVEEVERVR